MTSQYKRKLESVKDLDKHSHCKKISATLTYTTSTCAVNDTA